MDVRISQKPVRARIMLARNWGAVLGRGIAAIAFGTIALAVPGAFMPTLALFFASYLLVDGVLAVTAAVRLSLPEERSGLLVAEGLLDIVLAVAILFFPVGAVVLFVFATALWGLLSGALLLGAALNLAADRWWLASGGIVTIVWSILLVTVPFVAPLVLSVWFAGYAVAFGVVMVAAALRLRHDHHLNGFAAAGMAH